MTDTERCKEQISKNWSNYQCSNKEWKDGFCKIHHPDSVKSRQEKSRKRWEEKWEKIKERYTKQEESKKDTERLDCLSRMNIEILRLFIKEHLENRVITLREAIDNEMEGKKKS